MIHLSGIFKPIDQGMFNPHSIHEVGTKVWVLSDRQVWNAVDEELINIRAEIRRQCER